MRTRLLAFCCLLIAVLPAYGEDGFVGTGAVRDVHDPCMIKFNDAYYVYHTSGMGGPDIKRSQDLIQWESLGRVFDHILPWSREIVPELNAYWAPDVAFWDGRYYLYYSGAQYGTNNSFIGLAVNTTLDPGDAKYRWEDKGMVIRSIPGVDHHNCIDPNIIIDADGQPWMSFGSFYAGIKLVKLDRKTGLRAQDDRIIYNLAFIPERGHDVEAPYIVRKGEYYYLFASYGACCRGVGSTYHIKVGRSKSVTGPYLDDKGIDMQAGGGLLFLRGYYPVFGPGHNGVLMNDDGVDWLVHHFYDPHMFWHDDMWGKPTLQIRPIVWSKDQWPLPGRSYSGPTKEAKLTKEDMVGCWSQSVHFTDSHELLLKSDGTCSFLQSIGHWTYKDYELTLDWGPWVDTLVVARDGKSCVGFNQDHVIIRNEKLD
ncbi:arabinan endo-1,5-alpha-L-arabinosidase [Candidatus Sumerlaeota bacterium]|nr:arabinan endo-1,5-alpha-L-arabinosidase [Candidatus Sumerlaeota bacterium]